jgi:hypothetical protein
MGEEAWVEYQRQRKIAKTDAYKTRNVRKVVEWRRRTKLKLIEYKGGKCEKCGYNKPFPSCYDFHHLDPTQKEFNISGRTKKLETLKREADKCMLLCRNCHSEIHDIEYTEIRERNIAAIEAANLSVG